MYETKTSLIAEAHPRITASIPREPKLAHQSQLAQCASPLVFQFPLLRGPPLERLLERRGMPDFGVTEAARYLISKLLGDRYGF